MKKLLTLVLMLVATPVLAQHPAHPDVVSAVKDSLVAEHKDLAGCGAFEITKRVAWQLRAEGVGLLSKPAGSNCQGYSIDFVTYMDGSGVDILSDAGGANIPTWDAREPVGALLGRWEAPINPGGVDPTPAPLPTDEALTRIIRIEETANTILAQLAAHENLEAIERQKAEEFRQSVKSKWESIGKPLVTFIGKYVLPGALAFLGGRAVSN